MQQTNFWISLIDRLLTSNPKFFKYIQWVSIVVAAITGLPGLLAWLHISVPDVILPFYNKTIAAAAFAAAVIARLPNEDKKEEPKKKDDLIGGRPDDRNP